MKNKDFLPPVWSAAGSFLFAKWLNKFLGNIKDFGGSDPNATVVQSKSAINRPTQEEFERESAAALREFCPYITVQGDDTQYPIYNNANIGRYDHNDIQIKDQSVSRVHCRIFLKKGDYYLVDMDSTTGTKLGKKEVDNYKPRTADGIYDFKLRDGDTITVGSRILTFHKKKSADRQAERAMEQADNTMTIF